VSTLLIHRDGGRIGDMVDGLREWAAREYGVVPDAGHASNQDNNPKAFDAALTAFLARVLPSARPGLHLRDRLRHRAS
jgi:hypothetical protein